MKSSFGASAQTSRSPTYWPKSRTTRTTLWSVNKTQINTVEPKHKWRFKDVFSVTDMKMWTTFSLSEVKEAPLPPGAESDPRSETDLWTRGCSPNPLHCSNAPPAGSPMLILLEEPASEPVVLKQVLNKHNKPRGIFLKRRNHGCVCVCVYLSTSVVASGSCVACWMERTG